MRTTSRKWRVGINIGDLRMFTENKAADFEMEYVDDIKTTVIAFANCDGKRFTLG